MTLSVVGAGPGRTGAALLKVALEMPGPGRCRHMSEVKGPPGRTEFRTKAAAGKPDLPAMFDGYGATVDFPTAALRRKLAEHYPDAKINPSLHEDVRKAIPKERLLVFEAKDGRVPLCKFPGKPVPAEPYPRVNSKEEMKPVTEAIAAKVAGGLKGAALDEAVVTVRATVHGRKP